MNRIWAAVALFAILIGLSFWSVFGTSAISESAVDQIEKIEREIRREDYPAALSRWESIQQTWEGNSRLLNTYLNHTYLEVVDAELASLQVRLEAQEQSYALTHCSQLKEALRKIRKMETPYLENLL